MLNLSELRTTRSFEYLPKYQIANGYLTKLQLPNPIETLNKDL
jgi:hypothetical protein